jgi:hypothetical protein
MKFNPHSQELFTDDDRLIKRLHCPFRLDWSKLGRTDDPAARRCDICQHTVTDTAQQTEEQLLALLQANPHACLKVGLDQDNLTLTYHRHECAKPAGANAE